jgi:hypothetical protein
VASFTNGSTGRHAARYIPSFHPRDRIMRRRSRPGPNDNSKDQRPKELRNDDERYIALCLDQSRLTAEDKTGIEWKHEPDLLPTGLTGKGMGHIRPDFKVDRYGPKFYIEVTAAPARKLRRIKGAEGRDADVCILLIGPKELYGLRIGDYLIHELIERRLAARGHALAA